MAEVDPGAFAGMTKKQITALNHLNGSEH